MTDSEERRACPHCGWFDVPTLIVSKSTGADGGIGWRCRSCRRAWTDRQVRYLHAS